MILQMAPRPLKELWRVLRMLPRASKGLQHQLGDMNHNEYNIIKHPMVKTKDGQTSRASKKPPRASTSSYLILRCARTACTPHVAPRIFWHSLLTRFVSLGRALRMVLQMAPRPLKELWRVLKMVAGASEGLENKFGDMNHNELN